MVHGGDREDQAEDLIQDICGVVQVLRKREGAEDFEQGIYIQVHIDHRPLPLLDLTQTLVPNAYFVVIVAPQQLWELFLNRFCRSE